MQEVKSLTVTAYKSDDGRITRPFADEKSRAEAEEVVRKYEASLLGQLLSGLCRRGSAVLLSWRRNKEGDDKAVVEANQLYNRMRNFLSDIYEAGFGECGFYLVHPKDKDDVTTLEMVMNIHSGGMGWADVNIEECLVTGRIEAGKRYILCLRQDNSDGDVIPLDKLVKRIESLVDFYNGLEIPGADAE